VFTLQARTVLSVPSVPSVPSVCFYYSTKLTSISLQRSEIHEHLFIQHYSVRIYSSRIATHHSYHRDIHRTSRAFGISYSDHLQHSR